MKQPRIFKVVTAATVLGLASVCVVASPGLAVASTIVPQLQVCHPQAGTIMSAKPTSDTSAWIPTNLSSNFLAGPGTITYSSSKTSLSGQQISANFSVDEGLLFASVKEQYGITLQRQHSQTGTWSYQKPVPAKKTERLQQYHQGYEIGIKQTYMAYKKGGICNVATEKSLTGNFFPSAASGGAAYCWGLTPYKTKRIEVSGRCHDL